VSASLADSARQLEDKVALCPEALGSLALPVSLTPWMHRFLVSGCSPDCANKTCGPDGCGGFCGGLDGLCPKLASNSSTAAVCLPSQVCMCLPNQVSTVDLLHIDKISNLPVLHSSVSVIVFG
jgi:hypothetical protein